MADTDISERRERRRIRSRSSTEESLPIDSVKVSQKEVNNNNNNAKTSRGRRSRASTNSSEEFYTPSQSFSPGNERIPHDSQHHVQETSTTTSSKRRSRASRSSVEKDTQPTPPAVAPKPVSSSTSPTRQIRIPTSDVQGSRHMFENIVNKITKQEEAKAKQKEHLKEISHHSHHHHYDEYDDEYDDDDVDYEHTEQSGGKVYEEEEEGQLMGSLRQHMDAFEPFGQHDPNNPIDDDDLEDVENEDERYVDKVIDVENDRDARYVAEGEDENEYIDNEEEEDYVQSDGADTVETADTMDTEKSYDSYQDNLNRNTKPSKSFSTGSGGGQQQQQQKQVQQGNYQQSSEQVSQQRPAQQQQQRQRPQQSQQKPQSQTTNYGDYDPNENLQFRMSMRAPRAGDMFHNEMKMEKRYDEEEKRGTPQQTIDWIARSLQNQVPAPNGKDWKSIQGYLRDGVVLCKLMNRLLKDAGMEPIGYRQRVNSPFVALNNLETFIAGAKRYGVPETSYFQPSDLYEGKKSQQLAVINCLNALGSVANARGFNCQYHEPAAPKADWCKEECYD